MSPNFLEEADHSCQHGQGMDHGSALSHWSFLGAWSAVASPRTYCRFAIIAATRSCGFTHIAFPKRHQKERGNNKEATQIPLVQLSLRDLKFQFPAFVSDAKWMLEEHSLSSLFFLL